ncbi:MAG: acylphosphatase [Patescibacteria group bacterium]|jgi:acylphosphatase
MKKHFNIHVKGRVQGVGFRMSAKQKAQILEINGFVRNEPDGSVYIEAEGNSENLREFIAWCKQGPRFSEVDKIDVKEGTLQNYENFTILYGT